MPRKPLDALLLTALIFLSGCASNHPRAAATAASVNETPYGSIEGTILTDELSPIEGAAVLLLGTNTSASTGAAGTFTMTKVPAGDQTLQVDAPGFVGKKVTLGVDADDTARVRVILKTAASKTPYLLEGFQFAAFAYYAYNVTNPATGEPIAWESYQIGNVRDEFRFRFDRGWSALFLELEWTPSTPLADRLALRVGLPVGTAGTAPSFPPRLAVEGASPLSWTFTDSQYKSARGVDPTLLPYPDSEMVRGLVRPVPSANGPVGLYLMQGVTVYGTAAYNGPLPPGYTRTT